jgi:hypothetical protein
MCCSIMHGLNWVFSLSYHLLSFVFCFEELKASCSQEAICLIGFIGSVRSLYLAFILSEVE